MMQQSRDTSIGQYLQVSLSVQLLNDCCTVNIRYYVVCALKFFQSGDYRAIGYTDHQRHLLHVDEGFPRSLLGQLVNG